MLKNPEKGFSHRDESGIEVTVDLDARLESIRESMESLVNVKRMEQSDLDLFDTNLKMIERGSAKEAAREKELLIERFQNKMRNSIK